MRKTAHTKSGKRTGCLAASPGVRAGVCLPIGATELRSRYRKLRLKAEIDAVSETEKQRPRIHLTVQQGTMLAMLLWELYYSLPREERTRELGAAVDNNAMLVNHPLATS